MRLARSRLMESIGVCSAEVLFLKKYIRKLKREKNVVKHGLVIFGSQSLLKQLS